MGRLTFNRQWFRKPIRKPIRGHTLRRQIIVSFHSILGLSLFATLLTLGFVILVFSQIIPSVLRPANYYEQQVPSLVAEFRKHVELVMIPAGREWVESIIPLEGIQYEVLLSNITHWSIDPANL